MRENETWIFSFFFSTSERLARSGTKRNLLRWFLTSETAALHLLWASKEGFLGSTSKFFKNFSISFRFFSKQPNNHLSTSSEEKKEKKRCCEADRELDSLSGEHRKSEASALLGKQSPYYCTHCISTNRTQKNIKTKTRFIQQRQCPPNDSQKYVFTKIKSRSVFIVNL